MSGALYYHFFQLRELLQIILTTFQAEPLSLFSEFSTIVMVDCSFSSYTYMNGLHTGPEKDKFLWSILLYQNPVNPILHLLKSFEAIDNFKKEWNYFLFMIFGPSTFYKLITAVLLERSIVFVHYKHSVLSSVILALKALLRPFMWCY